MREPGRTARSPFILLLVLLVLVPAAHARPSRREQGEALVRSAQQHLARGSVEHRRAAVQDLERATQLVPDDADWQLQLARAYYRSGWLRAAMKRFERVAALQPNDADARYGLAQVWRRDWLKYLERGSLDHAIRELRAATATDSAHVESWVLLASLLTSRGDSLGALAAAERAAALAPTAPDARLARASGLWRVGRADDAAAEFRATLPVLEKRVRERFDDFAPLASERDTAIYNHLAPAAKLEFARRFWAEHDPDLATPLNEAQLEYWSRCTQAYFLYYDRKHHEWDERGELLVRYGPPEAVAYNPIGTYLYSRGAPGTQMQFPMNVLVWSYPSLGMRVTLQDRVLSEYYLLPMSSDRDMDPRPAADSLGRGDRIGTHQLRGVFPTLPPATRRLPLRMQLARFTGAAGPQLFAAAEAPARPGDAMIADCVVFDSLMHEVARVTRALSPSACRADSVGIADVSVPLPPGEYTVGFSVRAGALRGNARAGVRMAAATEGLSLSDLMVTCGTPPVAGTSVRLDANPGAEVPAGEPLTAYFEVYGLAADTAGVAHFEYTYRVRSATRDRRVWVQRVLSPAQALPELDGLWSGANAGPLRRQFVSVPIQDLPPGRWRLEVRARDLVTGEEAAREAQFTRLPTTAGDSR
ncbi:MAG: tetratricopeptide repeat protein [Candidatus Eisenbacteria bacterium]